MKFFTLASLAAASTTISVDAQHRDQAIAGAMGIAQEVEQFSKEKKLEQQIAAWAKEKNIEQREKELGSDLEDMAKDLDKKNGITQWAMQNQIPQRLQKDLGELANDVKVTNDQNGLSVTVGDKVEYQAERWRRMYGPSVDAQISGILGEMKGEQVQLNEEIELPSSYDHDPLVSSDDAALIYASAAMLMLGGLYAASRKPAVKKTTEDMEMGSKRAVKKTLKKLMTNSSQVKATLI